MPNAKREPDISSRTRSKLDAHLEYLGLFGDCGKLDIQMRWGPYSWAPPEEAVRAAAALGRRRSARATEAISSEKGRAVMRSTRSHLGPTNMTVMENVERGVPNYDAALAAAREQLRLAAVERGRRNRAQVRVRHRRAQQGEYANAGAGELNANAQAAVEAKAGAACAAAATTTRCAAAAAAATTTRCAAAAAATTTRCAAAAAAATTTRCAAAAAATTTTTRCAAAAALSATGHTGKAAYLLSRLVDVVAHGEEAPDYLFDGASGPRTQRPGFMFPRAPPTSSGGKRKLIDMLYPHPQPPQATAETQEERNKRKKKRKQERKKKKSNMKKVNAMIAQNRYFPDPKLHVFNLD